MNAPRGQCQPPGPGSPGGVEITLYALLAAPANLLGEENHYIAWSVARAIDRRGSGRVRSDELLTALCVAWSRKQAMRILDDERLERWLEADREYFRVVGQRAVYESFEREVEIPNALHGRSFNLADLNTRPRRTAALVVTVVGEVGPRSLAYIHRFCGVDRNTLQRWKKDPFVVNNILKAHAEWAVE